MHAPEKSIQKYMKMWRRVGKVKNERYQRMLQMGIIEKERWPLPTQLGSGLGYNRSQAVENSEPSHLCRYGRSYGSGSR